MWREVFVHMLILRERWRNSHRKTIALLRSHQCIVRQTRTRTVNEDVSALRNLATHLARLFARMRILNLRTTRGSHDADFETVMMCHVGGSVLQVFFRDLLSEGLQRVTVWSVGRARRSQL